MNPRWRTTALMIVVAGAAAASGCTSDDAAGAPAPVASSPATVASPATVLSAAASPHALPACSTLNDLVLQRFVGARMAADHAPQAIPGAGFRQVCTATAQPVGYPPLPISIEFGRILTGAHGQSPQERVLTDVPRRVAITCPADSPPVAGSGSPHTWSCPGPAGEVTPVAGVAAKSDYVIVFLVGFTAAPAAVHDQLVGSTKLLALDVLGRLSAG